MVFNALHICLMKLVTQRNESRGEEVDSINLLLLINFTYIKLLVMVQSICYIKFELWSIFSPDLNVRARGKEMLFLFNFEYV